MDEIDRNLQRIRKALQRERAVDDPRPLESERTDLAGNSIVRTDTPSVRLPPATAPSLSLWHQIGRIFLGKIDSTTT